ncbi:MAG: glycosyltransferase [Bacteroidota bacterium]
MNPKVSVLMPVYNTAPFLKEAIESILAQTYQDFELIIINDGSTDNSPAIIKEFKDSRIKFINNERNLGIIKTRNNGLIVSRGVYIVCMDSDDVSQPTRIEKQVRYLDSHPEVAVIASKLVLINEKGEEQGYWDDDYNCETVEQIKHTLPIINCIGQPTVMIRSDVVKQIGYNKSFVSNEDWGLWLAILSKGLVIAKLDEVLLKYRIHSTGATVTANREGVRKRILRFKYQYVKYKLLKFDLKGTDYKVLISLFKDTFRYFFPWLYSLITKVYSTKPLKLIAQLKSIQRQLSTKEKPITHIFCFPFYHIGGAEAVHASVLETVSTKNPIVLINNTSSGSYFLNQFQKSAKVLDIEQLMVWPFTKRWLIKRIEAICENNSQIILFGSNSRFFYEVVEKIPSYTKSVDLIHAFMHKHEVGAEKWSLPVIPKLTNRIIINRKTLEDLKELYKDNNIIQGQINKVVCITNFVEEKSLPAKNVTGKLKIIYVGRGSSEKRTHLIGRAARFIGEKELPAEFHFIGNIINGIAPEDLAYCILHGEVSDKNVMNAFYNEAHIIVIASSREGFPMVIMEAMMQGVVPISTNVGGISEHVKNNTNGILIDSIESDEIVKDIERAIEYFINNRDELKQMSVNAHNYAITNFNKKRFVESYQKILSN